MLIDQFDVRAQVALHLDIELQTFRFIRMNNSHESRLAKISGRAHDVVPILKHMQADERHLHFSRKAVVHSNQRGRTATPAAAHMILVDDHDLAGFAFREMKRDRCAHDARSENHDVSSLRK